MIEYKYRHILKENKLVFGNKNRVSAEEIAYMKEQLANDRDFFENISSKADMIQADYEEMENSRQLEISSLKQLEDNAKRVSEFSKDNIDGIASLNESFTECVKTAAANLENLENAARAIAKQHEDTCALVENNKHFTTPSKYLSEVPDKIKDSLKRCSDITGQMEDQNKQMSVLALNAAIEAGMMGDSGKRFVEAAESIRTASVVYDGAIDAMKEELSAAEEEIVRLHEQVAYLVNLLKDNNVATNNLMKQGVELNHVFSQCDEISVDMIESCRQQIVAIRNAQDEIIKCEDRNKLQIEDVMTEISTQRGNSSEIRGTLNKILEYSKERTRV